MSLQAGRRLFLGVLLLSPLRARAQGAGFGIVGSALAAAMEESAAALRNGGRHDATRALDRARRLARFADTARGLAAEGRASFADARHAVERGRHELQMGRPAEAARLLAAGARRLADAAFGDSRPVHVAAGRSETIDGMPVIDARGEEIGSFDTVLPGGEAVIAAGGMLGIGLGARPLRLPADSVLLGGEYLLATTEGR